MGSIGPLGVRRSFFASAGAALALALIGSPLAPAQSALQAPSQSNDEFRLRVETDLVVLYTTVTDKNGRPVTDLTQNQFRVFDNKEEQKLKVFKREDIPVSAGIIVDNSGSMRDKRKGVNAAAMHFVKSSNPLDEVFIVNFNEDAFLDADFTGNIHLLEEALEKIDSRGGTALYDALDMSLKHIAERATLDKKVLIAITDGEDNASRISLEQIVQTLERSSVMVYTVALIGGENDRVTRRAKRALQNISQATGANAYFPKNPNDVLGIATQIANEIRNQYVLAYTPPNLGSDTSFHRVEVRVDAPKKGKLNVRTRTGYYPQAILQTPPEETSLKEPGTSGL